MTNKLIIILLCLTIVSCKSSDNEQTRNADDVKEGSSQNSGGAGKPESTVLPKDSNSNSKEKPKTIDDEPQEEEKKQGESAKLILGNLKQVISDGCSCSVESKIGKSQDTENPNVFFITDLDDDAPAYLNINGVDTKLTLKKQGKRPDLGVEGATYEDTYEASGLTAKIKYVEGKSACGEDENCESAHVEITITVSKDGETVSVTKPGICGC